MGEPRLLTGWGRTAPTRACVHTPRDEEELAAVLRRAGARGAIARGLGRSYGDAAQNAGGDVLATARVAGIQALDVERRTVRVAAGTSIADLTAALLAHGLFPPVVPGTAQVTVGGALACDVHGKNHHVAGSFARHVAKLTLLTPDGERREVLPDDEAFAATAGGMGLTGIIVDASLRLLPVETAWIRADTERASDLDDLLDRMERSDHRYRYSAAWVDLLAGGRALGRAVLRRGDHAARAELPERQAVTPLAGPSSLALATPPWLPGGLLRRATVRAFNELWFHHSPRAERGRLEGLRAFFQPLDNVAAWNRLYGPRGFVQYQFAIPFGREQTLRAVIQQLVAKHAPSFLAVLKRLGPGAGLLSFPREGWTLTLDVPAGLAGLVALLDGLDELVADAGGRVYLAKDARLRPELLGTMYPELERWRAVRARLDPGERMRSDLSRRLGL